MRLTVQISGSVDQLLEAERRKGGVAVKTAMNSTSNQIKLAWREQILAAKLGSRLANSVRSQAFPKSGGSIGAAAMVWTRAPKTLSAFERGAVIRAQNSYWLAIPLPAAGAGGGGGRLTPEKWEQRRGLKLRFVFRRDAPSLLVAEGRQSSRGLGVVSRSKTGRGRATVPIFLLVRQVTLKKRLDLFAVAKRLSQGLPARIVANWK